MAQERERRQAELERAKKGAADWRLLLQLDGLECFGGGHLTYGIRWQDLAQHQFDRAWCLLDVS